MNFNYPYEARTYLNNMISPLPGSIILGIPFVLIGTSAFQNFFWLIILSYIYKAEFGIAGLFHLMVLFFLSPVLFYLFFTGSDYISNSIYIFFAFWLIKEKMLSNNKFTLMHFVILLFAGLAFSSRLNYLVMLPVFFGFLLKKSNVKQSLVILISILAAFLLVTLPFYFYSPGSFSPLHTMYKLTRFNELLPNTDILVIIFTALVSVYLSFRNNNFKSFLENASYALAFPVIITIILFSILSDELNFYTFFGSMYLIFACHPILNKILAKQS